MPGRRSRGQVVSGSYWDTSCVLPLYVQEPATPEVVKRAGSEQGALMSSVVLEFEFLFALRAKVARGELPDAHAENVLQRFLSDLESDRYMLAPLGRDIARRSLELSEVLAKNQPGLVVRTLDGIHLATALHLGCATFVTADEKLARLAVAAGFVTAKPGMS